MKLEDKKPIIGFIGLGVMGNKMAFHILKQGYKLYVNTRTKSKAKQIIAKGAVWEDKISKLSQKCDVIISIVGFPLDVKNIYLKKNSILNHAKKGTIVIDMTTSTPDLAIKIYKVAKKVGIQSLDAPVSGGDLGAKNASLSIMVGGDKKAFNKAMPILKLMGNNIVYQGKAGSGQHTKAANQIAIAAGLIAVCESLSYAKKAKLDPTTVLKSIGKGAARSWSLDNLGPKMLDKDMRPGFYIKHFIKDMKIASLSSASLKLNTPGLKLALSLYKKMAKMGYENKGTQALFELFD